MVAMLCCAAVPGAVTERAVAAALPHATCLAQAQDMQRKKMMTQKRIK